LEEGEKCGDEDVWEDTGEEADGGEDKKELVRVYRFRWVCLKRGVMYNGKKKRVYVPEERVKNELARIMEKSADEAVKKWERRSEVKDNGLGSVDGGEYEVDVETLGPGWFLGICDFYFMVDGAECKWLSAGFWF
jgi:hypothetical protein